MSDDCLERATLTRREQTFFDDLCSLNRFDFVMVRDRKAIARVTPFINVRMAC